MAALLTVKDLQVEFHTRDGVVRAVNGVTFALERGKVLALLGESGSGKSVTMRSLVRLLPKPRTRMAGEITLKGQTCMPSPRERCKTCAAASSLWCFRSP